jgi:hypothetical protein
MSTKTINIAIITLTLVMVAIVLVKYMKKQGKNPFNDFVDNIKGSENNDPKETESIVSKAPSTSARPSATAWGEYDEDFDPYKVVGKGNHSASTKKIQSALNRILTLKGKSKISTDGKFGDTTEKTVKTYLDKEKASYSQVQKKVIKMYEADGKPNPYQKEDDISLAFAGLANMFGF